MTFALPMGLAGLAMAFADNSRVFGLLLVASLMIFIGTLAGSATAAATGVLLFGLGAIVSEAPVIVLVVVGLGLFTTLVAHDLAGALRRAPRVSRRVWSTAVVSTAGICGVSSAAFGLAYATTLVTRFQTIVVPFGVAAIGFAAKLAADAHRAASRSATSNRTQANRQETTGSTKAS